jgi:hypothetical protein
LICIEHSFIPAYLFLKFPRSFLRHPEVAVRSSREST